MNFDKINYKPSFSARLQLNGNAARLPKEDIAKMENIADEIGTPTSIIDVYVSGDDALTLDKGRITIATFVGPKPKQFYGSFQKDNMAKNITSLLQYIQQSL